MASKIGEVLEIELEDSYIKKLVCAMITMETRDIGKLARYICIPSMVKGQLRRILQYKKSYTRDSQINVENAANSGISLKRAQ
jgi:hypothetical protein